MQVQRVPVRMYGALQREVGGFVATGESPVCKIGLRYGASRALRFRRLRAAFDNFTVVTSERSSVQSDTACLVVETVGPAGREACVAVTPSSQQSTPLVALRSVELSEED